MGGGGEVQGGGGEGGEGHCRNPSLAILVTPVTMCSLVATLPDPDDMGSLLGLVDPVSFFRRDSKTGLKFLHQCGSTQACRCPCRSAPDHPGERGASKWVSAS